MSPSPCVLGLLEQCSSMREIKQIHGHAITNGLARFAFISSKLLAFCSRNDLRYAHTLFSHIPFPTLFDYNTIIQDTEELKRVFSRFDANCDGKISVTELHNVLRSLGSGVPPEEMQRVMDELDTDHDGFINLSEFAAFCRSETADGGDTELHDAFNLYDQDKNGLISATELCQVLNRLGMKCSVEECHDMIKSVDSDGDGNVNFPEFKRMMSNNRENAGNGEEKID